MNVTLRPATDADEPFLFRLYASTREDIASMPPIVRMQFNAQRASYAAGYPDAEHRIILVNGEPAGRVLTATSEGTLTLVDISLLPEWRSHGVGTKLIAELKARCRSLLLHVATSNVRARALYERLGLRRIAGDAMYDEMRWDKVK